MVMVDLLFDCWFDCDDAADEWLHRWSLEFIVGAGRAISQLHRAISIIGSLHTCSTAPTQKLGVFIPSNEVQCVDRADDVGVGMDD